jgi:peptidoglycan/LPS O-acetylase OafA/YrhL
VSVSREHTLRFKGRIPGLDALRGLAIAMVVIYHGIGGREPFRNFSGLPRGLVYVSSWGSAGVYLFYVLSGFLITGIILDGASKRDFYASFYRRRAARILPAYFLLIVVLKITNVVTWNFVLASLLFIANMSGLVGARTNEYGPLWSLAVEEQFYLLWPWIARRLSLQGLLLFIAVVPLLSLIALVVIDLHFPHLDSKYKLWGNAPWLLAGSGVAVGLRGGFIHRDNIKRIITGVAVGALVTSPIIPYVDFGRVTLLAPLYRLPFVLVFVALLLIVILRNRGDLPQRLPTRVLVFLGYISYGLYLVHQLIFMAYERMFANTRLGTSEFHSIALRCVICAAVSIGIAYISRKYFEERFLRAKRPTTEAAERAAG